MNANRKITLIIFSMVSILTAIIVILVAIGSRESGYEHAEKRAQLTAEIVKNALTAYMVNGNMHQRDVFLDSMKKLENVKDLWVVRAQSVTDQYGEPMQNEKPRDAIDKEVLRSGIEITKTDETFKSASLRTTIPYIASANDKPNCLTCHNAKEGETLGAISLEFDIQDDRVEGVYTLTKIIGTSIIFLIVILIFISRKIQPYTSTFDSITNVLKRVHEGDYSIRAKEGVYKEDKEAAKWLNEMIEKLETVLSGIEKNLTSFVHNRAININNDKLLTAQEIIQDIADIYNFKKTIETDLNKDDIYYRLIQTMKNKLKIKEFVIFENNLNKNDRTIIYESTTGIACCELDNDIKNQCRAERTNMVIQSDNFPEICMSAICTDNEKRYICIPFQISEQKSVTISIISRTNEEHKHSKYQIGIIKKYIEEAKPILESRMLMDVLKERNFVDGLTGLYNRKFLDEFIDTKLQKELDKGSRFAIMLLDVDYFKMVNDTYGHDAGDAILQKLSEIMRENVGSKGHVIRFGGEEFLILLVGSSEDDAYMVATDINKQFGEIVFQFNNESFNKTVSIGYSFFPDDTDQIWKCIKYADLCLYKAKETGRNRVIKFDKSLLKDSEKKNY
ncbi:MAG: GGDEF domain-containing protein [Campylobacterales bacterium]